MYRQTLRPAIQALFTQNAAILFALVGGNLLFNIVANASFKLSAASPDWRGFLTWQVKWLGTLLVVCGIVLIGGR